MKRLIELVGVLAICAILGACATDDDFTTSATARLTFSSDTLSMDTVLSEIATSTRTFTIYNKNDKGIRIRSAHLEAGANSPFRVNIDGVFIHTGYAADIEVRRKDSVAVFVAATLPESGEEYPLFVRDKLVLLLESGATQEVVLEAYGQDVETKHGWVIATDTVLSGRKPYHIFDSLYVAEGATLSIEEGVRFYFRNGAGMRVDGRIVAHGTVDSPIVFRGDRTDDLVPGQPYDRVPGQWKGILLTSRSFDNHFDYCDIHSADYGIRCDSSAMESEKLRIENSIIHNMKGDALELRSCKAFVGNSQLSNAGGNCVTQYGGDSRFIHCTLANFYLFDLNRGAALFFSNQLVGNKYPIERAEFINCMLTGYSSDEIYGEQSDDKTLPFRYQFSSCLMDMAPESGAAFVDVLWDTSDNEVSREGNFVPFDTGRLLFDFRLDQRSVAIGSANVAVTREYYPFDRLGNDRLSDGKSDMGCYEFVPASPGL